MAQLNRRLENDWFDGFVPSNIRLGREVFLETTYGFSAFYSERNPALLMGDGSGAYGVTMFATGPAGCIEVGAYTCLRAVALCCNQSIRIGAHCLISWGAVLTDIVVPQPEAFEARRRALIETAADPSRRLRPLAESAPVEIEDNVWIGFDSVIGAGVHIGRGSVIGCKTIITEDVPPYTLMVGNPARIICRLDPDDTPERRKAALAEFGLALPETQENRG
jgi:acetyltransferase-like isoleucine patch superfamily enzyme